MHVDGPFGKAGTVMWVCPSHKALVQQWNDGEVDKEQAILKAKEIMLSVKWPSL